MPRHGNQLHKMYEKTKEMKIKGVYREATKIMKYMNVSRPETG